ncbi:hypothetical protein BGZ83_009438 [Gryganskiella cystojenkinii]|nr:hypothetical protein BGZ83_009438 [Gryganskiella cystojenkinii]
MSWGYDDNLEGYFFALTDTRLESERDQTDEVTKITEKVSESGGGNYFDLNSYPRYGFAHRVSEKTIFTFMRRFGIDPTKIRTTNDAVDKGHSEKECGLCGTPEVLLKRCSRCKNQSYCSKSCQTADWKTHKTNCHEE